MACIEISAENITAPHLDIEATHICMVSEGDKGVPAEFSFRASGGKSIKDGAARIKRLRGNSVVWNNMVDTRGYEAGFLIREGIKIQQGHKYLLQRSAVNDGLYLIPIANGSENYEMSLRAGEYAKIFTSQYTDLTEPRVYAESYCGACVISDLTLMFGAGNEPTTIEEYCARKPIVDDEYAYNEGEVIHLTAEGIKSVGDNAWDEEWRLGYYNANDGSHNPVNTQICSKNPIRVLPNSEYYITGMASDGSYIWFYDKDMNYLGYTSCYITVGSFTTPSNAAYIHFNFEPGYGVEYKNDIMITLVRSGWKQDTDAEYQPYWEDRLIFDQRIKEHFPDGMKKWDMVYNKNGKGYIVKGAGVLDLGELEWNSIQDSHFYTPDVLGNIGYGQLICAKYVTGLGQYGDMENDKTIGNNKDYPYNMHLFVRDDDYTDAASFKAAIEGVLLYYQLAEPTIIEYDEPFNLDYRVADFGTEQMLTEQPSAPISANIAYALNL